MTSDDTAFGETSCGPFALRWAESGPTDAPCVLLLHGLYAGAHSYEWRRLAPILAEDFRVRVPDLLGAGQSDRPPLAYSPKIVLAGVEALIGDAGPEVHVVASSLTAAYAVRAVADGAVPVASLALITPTGLGSRREPDRREHGHRLFDLARRTPIGGLIVRALTSAPSVSWFQRNKTYRDPRNLDDAEIAETRRAGRLPGASHLQLAFVFDRLSIDLAEEEVSSVAPAVMWGTGQGFVDNSEAKRWQDAGAAVQLSRAGLPQVEEPDELAAWLRNEFVADHAKA